MRCAGRFAFVIVAVTCPARAQSDADGFATRPLHSPDRALRVDVHLPGGEATATLRWSARLLDAPLFDPCGLGLVDEAGNDSLADTTAARKLLKYRPQVDFESGLARTFEWYSAARF